MLQNKLMNNKM